MILTAQNAVIKTATVQIKALTISGKQVTQAVFKQLKNVELIDTRQAVLNGTPWGIVNYTPTECKNETKHTHIVWQSGADLYRYCFSDEKLFEGVQDLEAYNASLLRAWTAGQAIRWSFANPGRSIPKNGFAFDENGYVSADDLEGSWLSKAVLIADSGRGWWVPESGQNAWGIFCSKAGPGLTIKQICVDLWTRRQAGLVAAMDLRKSLNKLRESLLELDQLFIAV